jgi:transcription antitermination protein NusB
VNKRQQRNARELAFLTMFTSEAGKENIDEVLEKTLLKEEANGLQRLISEKVRLWKNNKETIDNVISGYLKRGQPGELAIVALTALRLGITEMEYIDSIPPEVAINEAVEITKKYGDDDLARFVNGVLDARLRAIRSEGDGNEKKE